MSGEGYLKQPAIHTKAEYRSALLSYPGNLSRALKEAQADKRKTLLGVAHGISSIFVTKLIASTAPDFIWLDAEHGIFGREALYDAIQAAQYHSEGKTMVIVRVPKGEHSYISTALDAGAAGIIMPHVEAAEEVEALIKDVYYPPIGKRSFSPWIFTPGISDVSLYPNDGFNDIASNKHICIIPQIESVRGMENLEDIARIPGVSALMFGSRDYIMDAGLPSVPVGEVNPAFEAVMTKFVATAKKYGVPLLGAAQVPALVPVLLSQGYSAVAVGFDYWSFTRLISGALQSAKDMLNDMVDKEVNGCASSVD